MKTLIQFFRRIPAFLEACNELADVNDIWRYGMGVAEAKEDRRIASYKLAAAKRHDARMQKAKAELANFCDTCVKFEQHGPLLSRYEAPTWEPVKQDERESYADMAIREVVIQRRDFIARIGVDEDEIRRTSGVGRGSVRVFAEVLGERLANHIANGILTRKEAA